MGRRYLDGDSVIFTRKEFCLVDAKLYDGTVLENLEPRRLFPVSGRNKYISLLDLTDLSFLGTEIFLFHIRYLVRH